VSLVLLSVTSGPFTHPHETEKLFPVAVHPEAFLTVIVWYPFFTFIKEVPPWYAPSSSLYSISAPTGLVTVTTALPVPSVQSTDCTGLAGVSGCAFIMIFFEGTEIHPAELVTVYV
jgi:hypothetical protein